MRRSGENIFGAWLCKYRYRRSSSSSRGNVSQKIVVLRGGGQAEFGVALESDLIALTRSLMASVSFARLSSMSAALPPVLDDSSAVTAPRMELRRDGRLPSAVAVTFAPEVGSSDQPKSARNAEKLCPVARLSSSGWNISANVLRTSPTYLVELISTQPFKRSQWARR